MVHRLNPLLTNTAPADTRVRPVVVLKVVAWMSLRRLGSLQRTQRESLGIRMVTPFRGMLRTRDELLGELAEWLKVTALMAWAVLPSPARHRHERTDGP